MIERGVSTGKEVIPVGTLLVVLSTKKEQRATFMGIKEFLHFLVLIGDKKKTLIFEKGVYWGRWLRELQSELRVRQEENRVL